MPVAPSCIIDPLGDQFLTLLPEREDHHPLGCHNPRIPDAVVFDKLVQALASGMDYERIADATCSATTIRRRRDERIALGPAEELRLITPAAYDQMIGLDLDRLTAGSRPTAASPKRLPAGNAPRKAPPTRPNRAPNPPS